MTQSISGRWSAASRWSGLLDFRPLLNALGGPEAFTSAPLGELRALGAPDRLLQALRDTSDEPWAGGFVTLGEPGYPAPLLDLPKPPPALWTLGPLEPSMGLGLAVVGSRACTPYGRGTAHRLGQAIAQSGGVVISGAARGVDAAAHLGALDGGGRTLAVLGAGLDVPAGAPAQRLRGAILEGGGALVSEMSPTEPPSRKSFPRRNRLIAALSSATIVVEAARRSGALHTAGFAQVLGREVLAVPGRIDSPASEGTLQLIEDGAGLLRSVAQAAALVRDAARAVETPASRVQRALSEPGSPLEVAMRVGMDAREVTTLLGLLELSGLAQRLPDHRYALRR